METCPTTTVTAAPQHNIPRTNDHEEGFFHDRCQCGSASHSPGPILFGVAALLAA